jgi:hypothetical protein
MVTCWVVFVVMCVAFVPLGLVIAHIHVLPVAARVVLGVIVIGGLWWGPFAYAMYLSISVIRNGDRRLLRRGIAGTAEVLTVKRTNTTISEGEFDWEAPRVYKYRLRVSVPGREPYEANSSICAAGIRQGSTVNVAVSRHNRHRVTIDVGQGSKSGGMQRRPVSVAGFASDRAGATSEGERLQMLAQLGRLHSEGVLTDAEFEAQKAKILAD